MYKGLSTNICLSNVQAHVRCMVILVEDYGFTTPKLSADDSPLFVLPYILFLYRSLFACWLCTTTAYDLSSIIPDLFLITKFIANANYFGVLFYFSAKQHRLPINFFI
ncbi:hypothetical protein IW261DRAFT_1465475 [Armillaria novae-zelandiae]|uniref:Uncharacterized protein n=1 Tax=Armillaria novae-zelandiae TaxID=153914 RepID=A0AA39PGJ5_9AGAR|nr:hypothetical protein IW261DRAFT_1465475 [Armillaria novae-zelandiae]